MALEFSSAIFGLVRYLLHYLEKYAEDKDVIATFSDDQKEDFKSLRNYQFHPITIERRFGLELLKKIFNILPTVSRFYNDRKRIIVSL